MLAMLGWIPILGPIVQGFFGFLNKFQDTKIEQIKGDTTVAVVETQASAQIIHDTADDIGIRFLRDVAIAPPVIWGGLIGWDTIVAKHWPTLMFHVADYPPGVAYIPYAAYAFLLGNVGLNIWRRSR